MRIFIVVWFHWFHHYTISMWKTIYSFGSWVTRPVGATSRPDVVFLRSLILENQEGTLGLYPLKRESPCSICKKGEWAWVFGDKRVNCERLRIHSNIPFSFLNLWETYLSYPSLLAIRQEHVTTSNVNNSCQWVVNDTSKMKNVIAGARPFNAYFPCHSTEAWFWSDRAKRQLALLPSHQLKNTDCPDSQ